MREADVAYCAGIVDGEGTIVVNRPKQKTKDGPRWYYRAHVKVTMLDPEAVDRLHEVFGGGVKHTSNGYYHWYLFAQRAADALAEMLPHLRVKRAQAEAVIAYQNDWTANAGKKTRTGPTDPDGERAYTRLRELKRVHTMSRYAVQPQRLSAGTDALSIGSDSPALSDGKAET